MMNRLLKSTIAAAAALAITAPALADEVWSTPFGDIIYEADLPNGMAVLSFPSFVEDSPRGRYYVAGLAGVYEERGEFAGFWIEPTNDSLALCDVAVINPETGESSFTWGALELVFVETGFPSAFVARRGYCFGPPYETMIAKPIVGDPADAAQ